MKCKICGKPIKGHPKDGDHLPTVQWKIPSSMCSDIPPEIAEKLGKQLADAMDKEIIDKIKRRSLLGGTNDFAKDLLDIQPMNSLSGIITFIKHKRRN